MAYCAGCGNPIGPGQRYCASCGMIQTPASNSQPKPKKSLSFAMKALITIALAILFKFGWDTLSIPNLGTLVNEQLTVIQEDKISEAYYGYMSKEFQHAVSLEKFKEFLKKYPIFSQITSTSFDEQTVNEQLGILKGLLNLSDGEHVPVEYQLVKEDNRWKISNLELILMDQEGNLTTGPAPKPVEDNGSVETVMLFLNALRQHKNFNDFKDLFSQDFQKVTTSEKFKEYVDSYPILVNHSTETITDRATQGSNSKVVVVLDKGKGDIPLDFELRKEGGAWKIWSLHVVLPNAAEAKVSSNDLKMVKSTVDTLFDMMKKDSGDKAYSQLFSQRFQGATPLPAFLSFIKSYPLLTNFDTINYSEPVGVQNLIAIEATLNRGKEFLQLQFSFEKVEDQWKILGVKLLKSSDESTTASQEAKEASGPRKKESQTDETSMASEVFDTEPLIKEIRGQLEALQAGDMHKAYQDYTSKAFQQATSFDDFSNFISHYPILSQKSTIDLPHLSFDNNIAVLSGTLVDPDNHAFDVEYDMVKENEEWKVQHLTITVHKGALEQKGIKGALEISKIVVGNRVDENGLIRDPKSIVPAGNTDIYVNVLVRNGVKGTKIDLLFRDLDTASTIPSVGTTLHDNGDSVVTFVFSAPSSGWPAGTYQLTSKASTGAVQDLIFRIE